MNTSINEILDLYTSYASAKLVILFILITIPVSIFFYLRSNSKKLLLIMIVSQMLSAVIYMLIAFIGNKYFATVIDTYNQIGLFTVILLNNLNLAKYGSDMIEDNLGKNPDPDVVNRKHFEITLNMGIAVLLLGLSIGLFVPNEYGQTMISIAIATILTLAANHLIVRKVFVDEAE